MSLRSREIKGIANQASVAPFKTLNFFAGYKIGGDGFLKDTVVTFHLDNLTNESPSYLNVAGGTGNGSTFGRFVSLGLSTRF